MFFCRRKPAASPNHIFIKDMVVEMSIGVFEEEKKKTQRVRINIDLVPDIWPDPARDNLNETISYDKIVRHILDLTQGRHFHLVETLAETIARQCLSEKRISQVTVRVEKMEIYAFAIPGVEITRIRA